MKRTIAAAILSLSAFLGSSCFYQEKPIMARPVEEQSHDYNLLKNEFDQYREKTEQRIANIEQEYTRNMVSVNLMVTYKIAFCQDAFEKYMNLVAEICESRARASEIEVKIAENNRDMRMNTALIKAPIGQFLIIPSDD
jgi:hypothetical protein